MSPNNSGDKESGTNNILQYRRRIELEDKAKVVLSVWGTESLLS